MVMESKYEARLRRFDGTRYRSFCVDPSAGLYYVFDTVHTTNKLGLEEPVSFDEAEQIAKKANEELLHFRRQRRGAQW